MVRVKVEAGAEMKFAAVAGVMAALVSGNPAVAQGLEEIVVTAERLSAFDPTETPHVVMVKRADNLITTVT
ncbi:MAG: hypothetical protein ACREEO_10380, partial [Phenylobacterium sp.]